MRAYLDSKSLLAEHISVMEMQLPDDFPDFLPDQTIESVFEELNEGVSFLRKKLGPEVHQKCVILSHDARAAYEAGDNEAGREALSEMYDEVTGKIGINARDMDPESLALYEAGKPIGQAYHVLAAKKKAARDQKWRERLGKIGELGIGT